jgi:hypothetical protein
VAYEGLPLGDEDLAGDLSVPMQNEECGGHAHDNHDERDAEQPHEQELRFTFEIAFHGVLP